MADWIPIARATECPPGQSIERVAGERIVALANVGGTFHAIDGLCPHQGGPLGTGGLCGAVLTCPWHGWQFDVATGRHQSSANVRQEVFEVREREGTVEVRVTAISGSSAAEA
jgi:nitrite reductase/ring-hydroxylating ferredoxin subunit